MSLKLHRRKAAEKRRHRRMLLLDLLANPFNTPCAEIKWDEYVCYVHIDPHHSPHSADQLIAEGTRKCVLNAAHHCKVETAETDTNGCKVVQVSLLVATPP
jgi:hypothetical protein